MRIKCPNCGAQYEVDDALIPDAGRDVQCSNCGKGWFQKKFEDVAEAAEEVRPDGEEKPDDTGIAGLEAEADDFEDEESGGPEHGEPHAEPKAPTEDDRGLAASADDDEEADEDESRPPQSTPAPRRPDGDALDILREEAERELRARRREAATIETQTEFGLDEGSKPASGEEGVKDRLAKLRGADAAAGAAAAAVSSSARRDLLPDIEIINSTLRSDAERAGDAEADADHNHEAERGRRGFRLGFAMMVLLAAVLLFLYIWAPTLARQYPGMESFLIVYVEAANTFRAWLEALLSRAIDAMTG